MSAGLAHREAREIGELRAIFFAQAGELLEQVPVGLLQLERKGADDENVRAIRRALQTIEGDAASMGCTQTGTLCHRLEDVLLSLARDPARAAAGVELLLGGAEALETLLVAGARGGDGEVPAGLLGRILATGPQRGGSGHVRPEPARPPRCAEAIATSGRGVGMDAVKRALEAVKGTVEIESRPGAGTCLRLRLPMTLAVIRTLLFEAGGRLLALPAAAIAEVARVRREELRMVDGSGCLLLRGQILSVVGLGALLGGAPDRAGEGYVLVLASGRRRLGLLVERLRGQQELVVRAVDARCNDSGLVAGASVLGDGRVALVLDELAVVRRAVEAQRERLAAR